MQLNDRKYNSCQTIAEESVSISHLIATKEDLVGAEGDSSIITALLGQQGLEQNRRQ